MTSQDFPAFVQSLPEADLQAPGLRGWLLQGDSGQVLYHESEAEADLPEHVRCERWGVVLRGRMELTVEGRIRVFTRGDMFHIPAGARHRTRVFPGFRAVEHLGERDGYRVKFGH